MMHKILLRDMHQSLALNLPGIILPEIHNTTTVIGVTHAKLSFTYSNTQIF